MLSATDAGRHKSRLRIGGRLYRAEYVSIEDTQATEERATHWEANEIWQKAQSSSGTFSKASTLSFADYGDRLAEGRFFA
jgi:hypothetical protein